jgi:hypothetical protein
MCQRNMGDQFVQHDRRGAPAEGVAWSDIEEALSYGEVAVGGVVEVGALGDANSYV